MKDYWLLVKEPSKAISQMRKHDLHRTVKLLLISSLLFAMGAGIVISKILFAGGLFSPEAFAGIALTVFALILLLALAMGLLLELVITNLGGKGKYYESISAIAAFLAAPSLGVFAASLLFFVPLAGIMLSPFIIALTFAIGMSSLYRAVKDLFRTDMITSFVSVSVFMFSFFVLVYGAFLLGILSASV